MSHFRRALRRALATRLVDAETLAGARIWPSRKANVWREGLPAACVYTESDSWAVDSSSPREYRVTISLLVETYAETRYDVAGGAIITADDELDELAEQVRRAIELDPTFGGALSDLRIMRSELEVFADGERLLACERLNLEADYYCTEAGPDLGPISEFLKLNARWDIPGGEATTLTSATVDAERRVVFTRP